MNFIGDRTDVSAWLIHFVRDRDPSNDFPGDEATAEQLVGRKLEPDASASAVLRSIVDDGALRPGFSFRGGKTTIYGGLPAVCLTEAPLYNFVSYVRSRGQSNRCSHYGVCVLKEEAFAAGARPVIYGVSGDVAPRLVSNEPTRRIIDSSQVPVAEQYRYVAYDPNRQKPLDWTHEREWRWTARIDDRRHMALIDAGILEELPALPIFRPRSVGGYFSKIGFLVDSREEANELAADLLRCADAEGNNIGEVFDAGLLRSAFVVPLKEVGEREGRTQVNRIEDLTAAMRVVARRPKPSSEMLAWAKVTVDAAKIVAAEAASAYLVAAQRNQEGAVKDVAGGAWVVTYDSDTEATAALLELGLAHAIDGQRYTVDALPLLREEQALGYFEAGAYAAAELLTRDLGQSFHVRSWWD